MISALLGAVSILILSVVENTGYLGVFSLMALESAGIPVPSEIIMPFSGFLVTTGRFSLWLVILGATAGNLLGSLVLYVIGCYGGRRFILKYGRYFFFSERELNKSDEWFGKYGSPAIFFSRMLPIVRTYISLPAGVTRISLSKFIIYTFVGSLPWNFSLAYIGVLLGQNWKEIEVYFRRFDYLILILILAIIIWWIWRHINSNSNINIKN